MKTPNPDHPIRNTLKHLSLASAMGAALYFTSGPAANAQTLNVNLDTAVRTGLVGPAGGSGKTWNTISTNNGALKDENNATSTVTISGGADGVATWISGGNPALVMLKSGTYTTGTRNLVISGLTAGHNYDLYIGCYYLVSGAKGSFSTTNTTTTVGAQSCDNGGANGNGATWVQGVNYVRFQAMQPDGTNKITVSYSGVSGAYCMVNGLQLVDNSPPVAPPTPANLAATPYYANVNLTWADAPGATGYKVKRATASGGPYTELLPAPTTTTFTDATVAPATTYYYKVAATNAGGDSADSAAVAATTWTALHDQSITFTLGLTVSKSWNTGAFADGATATSGLTVTYSSDNEAVATVNSSTGVVTLTGVFGTAHILANQPGDANFNAAPQVSQELTVTKATPVITWNEPAPIIVGTALGSTQLNATSGGVAGGFVYTPASGTVLARGSYSLSVQFTPTDSTLYDTPAAKQVALIVSSPPWINVNFDNAIRSGLAGPVGGLGTTWNTIPLTAGTTSSLLASSNAATTVGVTRSVGGSAWTTPPLSMLIAGIFVSNGSTSPVSITGLTAGMKYDLYIGCYYKDGGSKARFRTTNPTTTVGDQLCDNGGANGNGSTWVRGVNYAAFHNMEPDVNNTITFTFYGNGTYGMVNGLQLVEAAPVSAYDAWANGTFTPALTAKLPTDNQDGDSLTNLQEYAFGTDPTVSSSAEIVYSGGTLTTTGAPKIVAAAGAYSMVFGRRADYVAAGLTYTVQFSAGLDTWVDNVDGTNAPVQVATDGTINAMSVPFVDFITTPSGSQKPTFARVKVTMP